MGNNKIFIPDQNQLSELEDLFALQGGTLTVPKGASRLFFGGKKLNHEVHYEMLSDDTLLVFQLCLPLKPTPKRLDYIEILNTDATYDVRDSGGELTGQYKVAEWGQCTHNGLTHCMYKMHLTTF